MPTSVQEMTARLKHRTLFFKHCYVDPFLAVLWYFSRAIHDFFLTNAAFVSCLHFRFPSLFLSAGSLLFDLHLQPMSCRRHRQVSGPERFFIEAVIRAPAGYPGGGGSYIFPPLRTMQVAGLGGPGSAREGPAGANRGPGGIHFFRTF